MKNQFWGDNRDLLKFDLAFQIVKERIVDKFVYIPMPLDSEQPEPDICRHEAIGGSENRELVEFLDRAIINEQRGLGELEEFFRRHDLKAVIYSPSPNSTYSNRKEYLAGIRQELLTKSLVLVDPYRLEEVSSLEDRPYTDLRGLYERMDLDSYLMFTQRFRDDMYSEYLAMRTAEIKGEIPGAEPISLDDLDSIIFFLTQNPWMRGRLVKFLKEYTAKYYKKVS